MKTENYKLYDAFGELLYVLTMADKEIQAEEKKALQKILDDHPWSSEIKWSFNYESSKKNNLEDVYKKVLFACIEHGQSPEYRFMIEVMEKVAESSLGVDEEERTVIENFEKDLLKAFKEKY